MSLVDTIKKTFQAGSFALALALSSMTINSCSTVISQAQQTRIDGYSSFINGQFQSKPSGDFQKTVDKITLEIKKSMEGMDKEELRNYIQVTNTANLETHVRNFQRYPIELLEESNRNITDRDYKSDLPLALVFMSVYDHTQNILGIRALDVKPKELMRLTEGYKLILFEYATKEELKEHMQKVTEIFPESGRIKGLVMGSHGQQERFSSGDPEKEEYINVEDISEVFKPHINLFNEDAIVFLSSCHSGSGERKTINMANAFAEILIERRVYSCTGQLVDFEYELDRNNQVDPDSINLYAPGPTKWPFSNCTYVAFSEVGPQKMSKEDQFYYKYGKGGEMKLAFLEQGGIPTELIVENLLDPRGMNYIFNRINSACPNETEEIDYAWSNKTGLNTKDTAAALGMNVEELLSKGMSIVCSSKDILNQEYQLKEGTRQVLIKGKCMLIVR